MTKKAYNVAFGQVLKDEREKHGYAGKGAEFARDVEEALGAAFSLSTLRQIESGRQGVSVQQYAAIRVVLYGEISDLFLLSVATKADILGGESDRAKNLARYEMIDKIVDFYGDREPSLIPIVSKGLHDMDYEEVLKEYESIRKYTNI